MSRLVVEIRWLLQVALFVFLLMALLSYSRLDPCWSQAAQVDRISNWAGRAGAWVSDAFLQIFGLSSYWFVVALARHIGANYRRITRHETLAAAADDDRDDEPGARAARPIGWLAEGGAFVLVLLASAGVEALRMWSLKVHLPRAPGGIVGDLVAGAASHVFGFTGGTLLLLLAFGIGLSLYFRFS